MRSIITISLPRALAKLVKEEVRSGKYATTSEFFRNLLRDWQEEKLLAELRVSQKEIAEGKGKILLSLRDLR